MEEQELSISANEEAVLKRLKEVERTAEDIIKVGLHHSSVLCVRFGSDLCCLSLIPGLCVNSTKSLHTKINDNNFETFSCCLRLSEGVPVCFCCSAVSHTHTASLVFLSG